MANKQVKISEALHLLRTGYTRWESDAQETGKSIEHYFGLSSSESRTLFAHPKIKRIKTSYQTLEIIDDMEETNERIIVQPVLPISSLPLQPSEDHSLTSDKQEEAINTSDKEVIDIFL